jgi:hypothetical protein
MDSLWWWINRSTSRIVWINFWQFNNGINFWNKGTSRIIIAFLKSVLAKSKSKLELELELELS